MLETKKIKSLIKIIFIFFSFFIINSCEKSIPPGVKSALRKAGRNRNELKQVIEHYKDDKEKLNAAYFLIENMVQFYSYYPNEKVIAYNRYFYQLDSLQKFAGTTKRQERDSLLGRYKQKYGIVNESELKLIYDVNHIKAWYLIQNIDYAFYVWKNMPWAQHVNFNDFCEYILPYRLRDEPLTNWRSYLFKKYATTSESLSDSSNSVELARILNKKINKFFEIDLNFFALPYSMGLEELIKARRGSCDNAVDYLIYSNRSIGVPIVCDYVPQWGNRSMGHSWNAVLSPDGKMIDFYATDFGGFNTAVIYYKTPKIFRKTFAMQKNVPATMEKNSNNVPVLLKSKNIKDVTNNYFPAFNVKVNMEAQMSYSPKLAYLCVFDNSSWVPVSWGKIRGKMIVFKDMGTDIVYLPVICNNNRLFPVSTPLLLDKKGNVNKIIPDERNLQTMVIKRKYVLFERVKEFAVRMKGGWFEGANRSDFSDADTLYKIDTVPEFYFTEVILENPKGYRYFRYMSPKSSFGNVAEIEVFDKDKKLDGKPIGTKGKEGYPISNVFDNDNLSYYETLSSNGGWAGLDFHSAKQLSKIKFLPRNDQNNIYPGLDYELFYWKNGWVSLGRRIAKGYKLIYKNIPKNALYFLHCYSGGKEERIFTYENGQQVWW